jgi:O-acetylserine/cysteine efflux transporter
MVAALVLVPLGAPALVAAAPGLGGRAWGALAYIVVGATVTPYLLNAWALARVPASVVAIYIFLQPLIAVLLANRVLGERPGWSTAAAALLIGAGIALVVWDARRALGRSARAAA